MVNRGVFSSVGRQIGVGKESGRRELLSRSVYGLYSVILHVVHVT